MLNQVKRLNKYIQLKVFILAVLILTVTLGSIGCNGIFPGPEKSGPPDDHTDSKHGVLHKPGSEEPFSTASDCTSCHQDDLRGGVEVVEGVARYAPSCYQCHDNNWDD